MRKRSFFIATLCFVMTFFDAFAKDSMDSVCFEKVFSAVSNQMKSETGDDVFTPVLMGRGATNKKTGVPEDVFVLLKGDLSEEQKKIFAEKVTATMLSPVPFTVLSFPKAMRFLDLLDKKTDRLSNHVDNRQEFFFSRKTETNRFSPYPALFNVRLAERFETEKGKKDAFLYGVFIENARKFPLKTLEEETLSESFRERLKKSSFARHTNLTFADDYDAALRPMLYDIVTGKKNLTAPSPVPFSSRVLPLDAVEKDDVAGYFKALSHYKYIDGRYDEKYEINKKTRQENFAFLENLSAKKQKELVGLFEKTTGFPNVAAVEKKMRSSLNKAVGDTLTERVEETGENNALIYLNPLFYPKEVFPGDASGDTVIVLEKGDKGFKETFLFYSDARLSGFFSSPKTSVFVVSLDFLQKRLEYFEPLAVETLRYNAPDFEKALVSFFPPKDRDGLIYLMRLLKNIKADEGVSARGDVLSDMLKKSSLFTGVRPFQKDVFDETVASNRRRLINDYKNAGLLKRFDAVKLLMKNASGSLPKELTDDSAIRRVSDWEESLRATEHRPYFRLLTQRDMADGDVSVFPEEVYALPPLARALAAFDGLADIRKVYPFEDGRFIFNKPARMQNYAAIEGLTDEKDQKAFVKRFKEVTKFPKHEEVLKNIFRHVNETLSKTSRALNGLFGTAYDVLFWGVDPSCSLGPTRGVPLPASDLDKSYIVLKGTGDLEKDGEVVSKFEELFQRSTDQRIVTFVQDKVGMPHVKTVAQIEAVLDKYDAIAEKLLQTREQRDKYAHLKATNEDDNTAGQFNIDLAAYLGDYSERDEMMDWALFLEPLTWHEKIKSPEKRRLLRGDAQRLVDRLNASPFVRYSNAMRLEKMGKRLPLKDKLKQRLVLEKEFDAWPTEKQYRLVVALIKNITREADDDIILPYISSTGGLTGMEIFSYEKMLADKVRKSSLKNNNEMTK